MSGRLPPIFHHAGAIARLRALAQHPPGSLSLTWAPACMVPPAPYGADVASDALSVDVPHETRLVDREVEAFHASSFRDASCAAEPSVELPFEALVVREVRHIRAACSAPVFPDRFITTFLCFSNGWRKRILVNKSAGFESPGM